MLFRSIMVFFFKSRCGQYTIYMGKDKFENEDLIKYGLPEDVWFHVDDLSSAHVYLRMKPGMTLDDITDDLLLDCSSLVKANSIEGCKVRDVRVYYVTFPVVLLFDDRCLHCHGFPHCKQESSTKDTVICCFRFLNIMFLFR